MQRKILAVLEEAVNNGDIAGANVLVLHNGMEKAYLSSGFSDKENGRLMTRDTIFRLYSQTKPVTAAAAVSLMRSEERR